MIESRKMVAFKCGICEFTFDAEPTNVEDAPERKNHPFKYFADCPYCEMTSSEAPWQAGLFSAHAQATGPKSVQGKMITAKNLDGHDTSLTRFNAIKHGAYSKTALFFPARPGKYPACETCDVDYSYCSKQPACIKKTELVMQHLIAFQNQDPSKLTEIRAVQQANVAAIFDDLIKAIIDDGVRLKTPKGGFDKDGTYHLATYMDEIEGRVVIQEVSAHPLLKPLLDMLAKNNMGLGDLSMTPKVQIDQGIEMGRLASEGDDRESVEQHMKNVEDQLSGFMDMLQKSKEKSASDPILIEFSQEEA